MAQRSKIKRNRKPNSKTKTRTRKKISRHKKKALRTIRRRRFLLSDKRLQRGLRVLVELEDLFSAARTAGVTPQRFASAALRKGAIKKRGKRWVVTGSLPRRMLLFSGGKELTVTVRNIKSASLVGRYMAAVRQFLRTNKPDFLSPFSGLAVKDIGGKSYPFETNKNVLYRLSSAGGEAFEDIYRIVV
jgi:hypothetical protein